MKKLTLLALACCASSSLMAADLNRLNTLNQSQFELLAEDLGAALSYKALIPAEPLGVTGFDLGVELSATRLANAEAWKQASGSDWNSLTIPKIHAHKGLPAGIDVGAFYSALPNTEMKLWGGELRYSVLEGTVATPALAVRGSFSRLSGVSQLDFHSQGVDVSLSKGFLNMTPFIGLGQVWSTATPNVANLSEDSQSQTRIFAGLNVNFALANAAFELDRTGEATSFSTKLGFRF